MHSPSFLPRPLPAPWDDGGLDFWAARQLGCARTRAHVHATCVGLGHGGLRQGPGGGGEFSHGLGVGAERDKSVAASCAWSTMAFTAQLERGASSLSCEVAHDDRAVNGRL